MISDIKRKTLPAIAAIVGLPNPQSFSLKGSKYTLLKAEKKLSKNQTQKLQQLKEKFYQIFEETQSLGEGTLKLIDWLNKAQQYYQQSVLTIKRWLADVFGYFERRTTNGMVEGINNNLKLLKHSGFGFRNFNNFQIGALLFWHFPKVLAQ